MKKIISILALALVFSAAASAQEQKEQFFPGWVYGAQVGFDYTASQTSFGDLVSVPSIALSAGYEFLPWLGVRAVASGFQAKGFNENLYKFNYAQISADAVIDICNIFKYRYSRFFSPYVFLGPAMNLRFNNGASEYGYGWTGTVASIAGRAGLGANFRVNDAVRISLEAGDNVLSDMFNSVDDSYLFNRDHNLSVLVGVKFSFGQARKIAAVRAASAAALAAVSDAERAQAEADRLAAENAAREKAEADRIAAEKAARERAEKLAAEEAARAARLAAIQADIESVDSFPLFVIGQSDLTAQGKQGVEKIAAILNANPDIAVLVTGYADKETGYPRRNLKISEDRAMNVASALIAAGVDEARIAVDFKGDTEIPYEGANMSQKRTVTFKVNQ